MKINTKTIPTVESLEEGAHIIVNSPSKKQLQKIETEVYNASLGIPEAYTETIVNISSAQILAMGTTPVQLLPASGVGKYYDIDKIYIEYLANTANYTLADPYIYIQQGSSEPESEFPSSLLTDINNQGNLRWTKCTDFGKTLDITEETNTNEIFSTNKGLTMSTWNGTNPTLGDGTLRVKIYHKTLTFGA